MSQKHFSETFNEKECTEAATEQVNPASAVRKSSRQKRKPVLYDSSSDVNNFTSFKTAESNIFNQIEERAKSSTLVSHRSNVASEERTISSRVRQNTKSLARDESNVVASDAVVKKFLRIEIPRLRTYTCEKCPTAEEDEDLEFFRSLRTWTKHFNDDEKLQFRLEVMKIVEQIHAANANSNNYVVVSRMPL